jgi:serine/threonine-protein kinase
MELLTGEDLATTVMRDGPLPVDVATRHVLQACAALAEAHALGIVHRDIKPANLFLARRGSEGGASIKILDFGVSKTARGRAGDVTLTTASMVLGSPAYMSPEQLREARAVDARADIWALGVTLYELVTGRRPFVAATLAELHALILTAAPPSPRSSCPAVSPALEHVILRCLRKDPADRFESAAALAAALDRAAALGRQGASTGDTGAISLDTADPVARRRGAWPRAAVIATMLVACAAAAMLWPRGPSALGATTAPSATARAGSGSAPQTALPASPAPALEQETAGPEATSPSAEGRGLPAGPRGSAPSPAARVPLRTDHDGHRAAPASGSAARGANPLGLELQ